MEEEEGDKCSFIHSLPTLLLFLPFLSISLTPHVCPLSKNDFLATSVNRNPINNPVPAFVSIMLSEFSGKPRLK